MRTPASVVACAILLAACRDMSSPPSATPVTNAFGSHGSSDAWATTFTHISTGADHACALTASGAAYCWGDNRYGQLGTGGTTDSPNPQLVSGSLVFRAISAGGRHTCAVSINNTGHCWGSDAEGQLGGLTAATCQSTACALTPIAVNGNRAWSSIEAGGLHTCGLDVNGLALCWGNNVYGAVGDGSTAARRYNPTLVAGGRTWTALAAGAAHSCGLSPVGTAFCWGSNSFGQLGAVSTQTCSGVPCTVAPTVVVGNTAYARISGGTDHSCALSNVQAAFCWGRNQDQQLGDGTSVDRSIPTPVTTPLRFSVLATGGRHTCAVDTGNAAHCWGNGAQLGAGNHPASGVALPVIGNLGWVSLRAGAAHACGVASTGTLYCWGFEDDGELGDGAGAQSTALQPVPVAAIAASPSVIRSASSGFWDVASSWIGGIVPGNGDRVAIGSHTITVRDPRVIGDSPAENSGTFAIDFTSSSGALVVDGTSLTVRGDIRNLGGGTVLTQVTIQSNGTNPGILEFDASQAAAPAATNYRVVLMRANGQFAKWRFTGTPTARVQVRSHPGGGEAYFTRAGFVMGGNFEADFTTFTRLGNAAQPVYDFWLGHDGRNELRLRDVIFDTCGRLNATAHTPHAAADLEFRRVLWKNTTHATHSVHLGSGPATNKGVFVDSDPDKLVQISDALHWTLDGTFFHRGTDIAGTGRWDSAANVLLRSTTIASATQTAGDVSNWYVLKDGVGLNPHGILPRGGTGSALIDGIIFDYAGTSSVGDLVDVGGWSAPTAVTVRRAIVLQNANGGQIGKLVSILGPNALVTAEHNTIWSNGSQNNLESGVVAFGETYPGVDGMITSVKSNLVLGAVRAGGVVLSRNPSSNVQLSDPTIASHNATWQGLQGTDGLGYHAFGTARPPIFSSGPPGVSDVVLPANPVVDPTRNMKTWDASLGGPGTYAHAIAELRKRNDDGGFDIRYTFANLRAYIHEGFRPTTEALRDAGHDGITIGAVPMLPIP